MRSAGYSTGALALDDFRCALKLIESTDADAVELSALREDELAPLIAALAGLDLKRFRHVAVHAPSRFAEREEAGIVALLKSAAHLGCYVVVHPDAIYDVSRWTGLGSWLCIENMDKRKAAGRSADELEVFFKDLPEAGLCFDIAHARQFDSSMTEAYRILRTFANRLRQVHISEVNTSSHHERISPSAASDYQQVAHLIPSEAPIIVEAQVSARDLVAELNASREALTTYKGKRSSRSTRSNWSGSR